MNGTVASKSLVTSYEEDGFIDVRKLIAAYSPAEHVRKADAYYDTISDAWGFHYRKPFHDPAMSPPALSGLAAMLQAAELRRGHVVLDFGCGTGWLAASLALMGCIPIGVDVSENALSLARQYAGNHPALADADLEFARIDHSGRLPLESGSVDRILCFDSFHHVADQEGCLAEFARVLAPGGLAVFHEPGPRHSRTPLSQFEMREHGVIENDIRIEEIWSTAKSRGFDDIKMVISTETPFLMDLKDFNRGIRKRASPWLYLKLGVKLVRQSYDRRVFVLRRAGRSRLTSRIKDGLDARLETNDLRYDASARTLSLTVRCTNVGTSTWLPSEAPRGPVRLGMQLIDKDGVALRPGLLRFPVSENELDPGSGVELTVETRLSEADPPLSAIEVQLVSEKVAWFGPKVTLPIS